MADDLGDRLDELSLEVDTSALEPTTVDADPVLLELAVRNLVDNAVTHNVHAGRITLETASGGGSATLTVTNSTTTGAATDVAVLVQPFHRGDGTRVTGAPGFGVGLAVVDAVARAHEARLDLSRPTPSTFRASLCLADHQGVDRLTGQSDQREQEQDT